MLLRYRCTECLGFVDVTAFMLHVVAVQVYLVLGICGLYCGDVACWCGTGVRIGGDLRTVLR
jgi:hypothetical protein